MDILLSILLDSVMLLAAVAALMGLLIGLWMLIHPGSFMRFEERASRTISLRRSLRPLEISRNIDRHVYRHHKFFGLLIVLGSSYTIYNTLFNLVPGRFEGLIGLQFPQALAGWLINALNIFLVVGNIFAIVIGLIIFTRPSLLKRFEESANHWISLREKTAWMEKRFEFTEQLARTQPRFLGILFIILSVYLISIISIP